MKIINNSNEFDQLSSENNIVVADFYADWCGPCQVLLPIVEEVANDYRGRAEVVKVNVDTNQELAMRFGVRNIPTLLFIKNEKVVDRMVGVQSKSEIELKIKTLEISAN